MRKKIIFRWVKVLLLLYGIIGIALFYLQEKMMFRPQVVDWDHKYKSAVPYEEFNLPFNSNSNMSIARFYKDSAVAATRAVIYFHGNKGNIGRYARLVPPLVAEGYEVWMIDYPGYGKSTGEISEARFYDYCDQLYKLVRSRFAADSIIIYGKSLGTGFAAYTASRHSSRGLVLETPYYSMTSLAGHYFPVYPVSRIVKFKIPTYEYLPRVIAPVLIVHGTDDGVIPFRNAELLKPLLKKGDEFLAVEDGSHNNLMRKPVVLEKLKEFLNRH